MEKSLTVKAYSHIIGEQLEEINTVEELQEVILEIRKNYRNLEEKETLDRFLKQP